MSSCYLSAGYCLSMKTHGHHNTGAHGFNTLGFHRENPMAASLYWSLSKLRKGAAFIPFCEADHCVAGNTTPSHSALLLLIWQK